MIITSLMQLEFIDLLREIEPKQAPTHEQMDLDIKVEPTFRLVSQVDSLLEICPSRTITFNNGTELCGSLTWKDGVFKFHGETETSAKIFANYLCQYLGKVNS